MRQQLADHAVALRWQASQNIFEVGIRIMLVALPLAQTADDYEALLP
jgi:hypothetical protein